MNRLTRTVALLAAALLAAVGLTGCSDQKLGAAAVVDGHRISTDELQQETRAYLAVVPGSSTATAQLRILQRKILSAIIEQAARDEGVRVNAGQVAAQRDDLLPSVGGRKGLVRALSQQQSPTVLAPSEVDSWFRDRLLYSKLTRKLAAGANPSSTQALARTTSTLTSTARSMDIEVNPRYGRWSWRTGITPLVSGGLSRTADELAAGS